MCDETDIDRVVLVDMDGVLADFDGAVLAGLPAGLERMPRVNFYVARDYPEHREDVEAVYSHPEFFFGLPPVARAVEGWQRLVDLGYRPRICSAPLTLNPRSVEGKRAWLQRHLVPHFGATVVDRAIFDKRKFDYAGRALIDDRHEVDTDGGRARWRHIVFDQPYNRSSASALRIRGWDDPALEQVLSRARSPSGD